MAAGDLALNILIAANTGGAMGALSSLGSAFGPIGAGMATLAVGAGVAAVKMASDYQQSMNMVQALTGSNTAQMDSYSNSLKALAMNAGVAPTELSKGLYQVLSAGYSGAAAMQVLTLATEDSKIGMTSAAVTGNALTTVLKAFSVPIADVARVNGEMLETVTLGKMTMEQYAGAIGKASSTSMQFHVSMENMNASIATLTANGIPSASQAVTDYNQSLAVMYGNIGTVAKSLAKNGIAFNEAKFNTMSYTDKIQYMNQELQIAADKHVHITGVTKQAAAAIQIISQHSGEYAKNLGLLSDKQAMAQKTQQAWSITQSGFNQTLDRLKATLDVVMINIGSKFLPILTNIGNAVAPLISGFGDWISSTDGLGSAMAGLGTAFMPMTVMFQSLPTLLGLIDVKPLMAAFRGLGGAFSGLKSLMSFDFFNDIENAITDLASGSVRALTSMIKALSGAISGILTPMTEWITKGGGFNAVVLTIESVLGHVIPLVVSLTTTIGKIVGAFVTWLTKGGAIQIMLDTVKTVVGNIVPPVQHLTEVVGKIIADFITWGDKSGFFNGVLKTLGGTISATSGFVGTIIDKFASFIGYLNSGSAPANALKGALIGIGAAIALIKVGNFVADIIAMIPAMIGWIAETWAETAALIAEAIANIAANWPIYLIIAAIAALIAIIVLVVQHWGDIVAFLQGTWQAFANWFMGALHAVGQFFADVWNDIVTFITGVWNTIVNFIKAHALLILAVITGPLGALVILVVTHFTQIKQFITNIVTGIAHWLSSTWSNIVNTVVGWFKWLYNHNYYFKDLVDAIRHVVTAFVAWFENAWKTTVANVTAIWNGIKAVASTVWNAITSAIHTAVTTVHDVIMNIWNAVVTWIVSKWNWLKGMATTYFWAIYLEIQSKIQQAENFIHSVWSSIVSWLQGIWSTITGDVTTAWQNISNIFSSAWNTYVAPPLNSLKTSITNLFTDLANTAISWGKNIIQGFINGMTSMIGAVGNAAQNIISTVGGFLGFHSPAKEGPGKELDVWGPNLVKGFTTGIVDSLPMMRAAMNRLMQPLSVAMTTSPAQSSGNAFALSGSNGGNAFAVPSTATSSSGGYGSMNLTVELDGKKITEVVQTRLGKNVRVAGAYRNG